MNLYIFKKSGKAATYGVGTYIKELTAALRGTELNICVVNLMSEKPQIQMEEIAGIRYWSFPEPAQEPQMIDDQKQKTLYHRNIVYILQLLIEDKKDLVFHLNYNDCGKLSEVLRKAFDCRIIVSIHFFSWCFTLFGNVTRFRKLLELKETEQYNETIEMYRKDKDFFETADHIICLSKNTQQILLNDYQIEPDKMDVIYNCVADSTSDKDILMLRQKYHIPDIPIILFAGRLDKIKGLEYALRALKTVLASQQCHFIIAGDGNFKTYMKECDDIWMHITWTGLIDRSKLYDLYSIADIGVMPSFHEQCSFVAIEMMMHGVPLIASTSTGLKEMVQDGVTGLHIPVIEYDDRAEIDSDLLAEKMQYLLQHPDEQQRMGASARKLYIEKYSGEVFRKNMLQFYHSQFTHDT